MNRNAQMQSLIEDHIEKLERTRLDGARPPLPKIWGVIEGIRFLRVDGLAAFWRAEEECRYEQYMEDLITGCYGQGLEFAYLLWGQRTSIQVHVGMRGAQADGILSTALRGGFPGIELGKGVVEKLGATMNASSVFTWHGLMTGVPTLKAEQARDRAGRTQQIERLMRGLYGEEWGYFVLGRPVPQATVGQMAYYGLEQIRQVSAVVKKSVQSLQGVSEEQIDRQAQYCVDLLEKNLERLNRAKAQGYWQVDVHLFAVTESTLDKARALCNAIFSGEDSAPEPVRTFKCAQDAPAVNDGHFSTLLNSHELAVLAHLPREEMPGYAVRDYARFDVALPMDAATASQPQSVPIIVGRIMDGAAYTGSSYSVPIPDFAKHGLVVGVTGSGKTNTLFYLLDNLWKKGKGVPFLVIEPAKAEYRDLRTVAGLEGMRVFTLGDERLAPFRLNPFEFEIGDAENRVHVQTHIDYLKSVFNAAFILYAPMPYVLETCLHEIYQDKGWDLTTSQNRRLPPQERGKEAKWPVFPTLGDLYRKVDEVVDRLGYEERIQMDVKAGLKARIGSLRLGGKGLMLDVRHSVPMKELLAQPTVLELERIGNDDEKAFVIGLLLTRLYEYRVVEARGSASTPALRHVTVFEEAHRLLKNVRTDVGTEEANVKGQAVENFANMLSEIRAYGQGVLIAEQIPTKLAPDAIKNTNLKVLHRVVAADDRDVMGGTMNLDDAQKRFITTLRTGQAVVYAEGADRPYLVDVFPFKKQSIKGRLTDQALRSAMQAFCSQAVYEPVLGYAKHIQGRLPPGGTGGSEVRDLAVAVLSSSDFSERFNRYIASLLEEPRQAVDGYSALVKLSDQVVKLKPGQEKPVGLYVMLQAVADWLDDRSRRYGWLYNVAEALRSDLTAILADIVVNFENRRDVLDCLAARHLPALKTFAQQYRQLCARAPIPYAGCAFCKSQCFYRFEVAPLVQDRALGRDFVETIRTTQDDDAMWRGLGRLSVEAAERVVQGASAAALNGVALCYAAQTASVQGFSIASQRKLVKNVSDALAQQLSVPPTH